MSNKSKAYEKKQRKGMMSSFLSWTYEKFQETLPMAWMF